MCRNILKGALVIIFTFAVFLIVKRMIADVGGMPLVLIRAYQPAFFALRGIVPVAASALMFIIMVHLLLNFKRSANSIRCAPSVRGALYGFMYGALWFLGFLEMYFVNGSSLQRHALSGVRDVIALSAFGLFAGLMFLPRERIKTAGESLIVVVPVSACFAMCHQAQYFIAFPEIDQHVHDAPGLLWLLACGAWIGVMYYFLRPAIDGTYRRILFFSANMFGVNWLLYNSFYCVFLDIPSRDILIRTGFDIAGVFLGLCLYESMRKAECAYFDI